MIGPMRSVRSLALHSAARQARGAQAAGPAMTVLGTMLTRIAAIVRAAGAGYVLVQVLIWHAFYQASPGRLWGPAVAVGWAAAAICCLDWAVYAVLALTAGGCVPPEIRGQAGEWLFIAVASELIVPIWFARARLSLPMSLGSGLAFLAGVLLAPGSQAPHGTRAAATALLFAVVAVHWSGRQMLYRRASRADAALAAADGDARDQFVILSRNIERREQDRLLHDTVLNTLTAIARSGPAGGVISRCRQDLAMLQHALSEPADPAGALRRDGSALLAGLHAVAAEMQARGLAVHLRPGPGVPGQLPTVPAPVALAITHATREALANVAAHAGTGEAWVEVSLLAAAEPGGAAGGLAVTVRDAGAGFDPGQLGPARLGVRRSITERVTDWGGSATVHSAPGAGTEVRLCWPAQREAVAEPDPLAGTSPAAPAAVPW
jgi:signal transduction histidine kinase